MASLAQEEYELMKDSKYRVYVSAIDKVLKNFEYTSEWADLISALGKLNKVLVAHMKFPVIPRRITISKRLAQCMHPALPSGVHLKALETYDAIFKCMGTNRLAHELFIYSAGLFPLLGHAAMNVRLLLLTVYETHFVPLGERLRPALSGFLSGVLPGLEPGSDHYDSTNSLLEKVCDGVGAMHFYSCLWECLSCNSATRFPAISFILEHFNRKLNMCDQLYLIGKESNVMVTGLCACMRDHSVLVQRSALELLLVGIPLHLPLLEKSDMVKLIVAGLSTLLRRDMSLNRRLYAWLLGSEVNLAEIQTIENKHIPDQQSEDVANPYFELYSRELLVEAIRITLAESAAERVPDLKPYRLLMSLLDKSEIGPIILDDILLDLFRTLYRSCKDRKTEKCCEEIQKSSNMLLSSLEPYYIWDYIAGLFSKCCETKSALSVKRNGLDHGVYRNVTTDILELCVLVEYLLDTLPLETYVDTISEHLPKLFVKLTELLIRHLDDLVMEELFGSISLCTKIVSRVQTMVVSSAPVDLDNISSRLSTSMHDLNDISSPDVKNESFIEHGLEKSKSDSKLNNSLDSSGELPSPKKSSRKLFRKKKHSSKMHLVKSLDSLNTTTSSDDTNELCNDNISPRIDVDIRESMIVKKSGAVYVSQDTTKPLEKQTLLEKCIRIYEDFFVNFIAQRVLSISIKHQRSKINELFDVLMAKNSKICYDTDYNTKILEKILSNSINLSRNNVSHMLNENNSTLNNIKATDTNNIKFTETNNDMKLIDTIKSACRLLVELSSFPTYSPQENAQQFSSLEVYSHNTDRKLPDWLKILSLCACLFKSEPEVQLSAISTLLDLTSLLRTQMESRESSVGVTAVVVIPLLRKWHVEYLERNTQVFQILAYTLWAHLGSPPSQRERLMCCASLLHQLHDCVPPSRAGSGAPVGGAAERVIGESMGAECSPGARLESFKRFATLWHLGRSTAAGSSNDRARRTFDKALLKMLDNLQLPESSSLKLYSASWVTQSLLRGDLHRLLDPILFILLDPLTSRMSILHVSIQHSGSRLTNKLDSEYDQTETNNSITTMTSNSKVYAISSVDGNVIYHVSDDAAKASAKSAAKSFTKKIINPLLKNHKLYALKEKSGSKKNVIGKHYTVNDVPENGLAVSPQQNCLFVNPFTSTDCVDVSTLQESDVTDNNLPESKISNKVKKSDNSDQTSSESTSYADEFYDSCPMVEDVELFRSKSVSGTSSTSSDVLAGTHSKSADDISDKTSTKSSMRLSGILSSDGLIEQLEMSMNEIKDGAPYEAPIPADEYFDSTSIDTTEKIIVEKKSKKKMHKCYDNGYLAKGVHQLHSHMLLYCEVYDSNRTIYALQTLRNEILTNPRVFLCSAATTGISNVPRGSQLLTLLARHKKSIYGHGFYGPIANTEYIHSYRNCMYLEILITVSLHFARSYYPNLGNVKLTSEELSGNQKVQLASAELLMLICTQLISIVKVSGKGFASYIGDLLSKCRVHKVILHCVISSVYYMKLVHEEDNSDITFTEEIMAFNDPNFDESITNKGKISNHIESFQIQLLQLLQSLIVLEYQVNRHKTEDAVVPHIPPSSSDKDSPTSTVKMNALKYNPSRAITQQPIFLASILLALQMDTVRHLHQHWTALLTSSLPYITSNFKHIVISVVHQLCTNIEKISVYYQADHKSEECYSLPPDYTITQLEALTVLCHYCLLDSVQQTSHVFDQSYTHGSGFGTNSNSNPSQIFNNLIHVFMPTPLNQDSGANGGTKNAQYEIHMAARQVVLSHMPRIIASMAQLWENVTQPADWERRSCLLGSPGVVRHQLLEFLSPISLHHGINFLAAIAVAWLERKDYTSNRTVLPSANANQRVLVYLISEMRVMPMDIIVQTVHQVVKSPPPISGAKPDLTLDVGVLELFYWYMQSASSAQLCDIWPSLLGLLRDGLTLSPAAQFLMIAILNEYVQKCPQFEDKRDQRDLHDITSKLIDSVSQIAGCCLQQTTWLRRNLAVKEEADLISNTDTSSSDEGKVQQTCTTGKASQVQSVQAQLVLAELLATLLDVVYGSQEKVVTILTTLMYNITPYLKNHSQYNVPAFTACSNLLASLSGYQYTRKAWRKDVFDLLLDSSLFQMEKNCLGYWRTIIDNLMTHDNTTFRDFMNRVSLTQSGSLSLFSSREQEYEQRALLLRRLAFVIFCSETDQYYKYMPEIQEQMTSSLRLPQVVPSVQANVFLCFRVILLRMSSHHVTSLWPTIISELVQVLLQIEQELVTNTEEFRTNSSSHIKLLSALDNSWVTNSNNGLHAHGHPHWLQLQLAASKLLDLVLVLPAKELPQFQMYRWAFVSDVDLSYLDNEEEAPSTNSSINSAATVFVPHVYRLARLMDVCYKNNHVETLQCKPGELLLTTQTIKSLQELHSFFKTLSYSWHAHGVPDDVTNLTSDPTEQLESILENDFIEKLPE